MIEGKMVIGLGDPTQRFCSVEHGQENIWWLVGWRGVGVGADEEEGKNWVIMFCVG